MATITQIKQYLTGGFDRIYAYQLSPDGYALGSLGTALVKGATGSGPYRLQGAKTANVGIPKPVIDYDLGDDVVKGALLFAPATLPNYDLGVSIVDQAFDSIVQATTTYDDGNVSFSVLQPTPFEILDFSLVFFRRAKSQVSSTLNASMFSGIVNPKVNIYALGSKDVTERKIADYMYYVINNPATTLPDGISLPTNLNADESPVSPFSSPNRWIYYTWIGDGVTQVFNLPKTGANGFRMVANDINLNNAIRINGAKQVAGLTIDITPDPQTFTFGAPPADNSYVVGRVAIVP